MMKKYIVLTALTLTLTGGLLAGCGSGNDIGQEKRFTHHELTQSI